MKISRRKFIANSALVSAASLALPGFVAKSPEIIMTVNGPIPAEQIGFTLAHEHVLVDFIGAAWASKRRYDANKVVDIAFPFIRGAKATGVSTFVDCTPNYLGRDVNVLKKLSDLTGINVITNTGYYGALGEKFVPLHAFTETAEQIAAHWISEWVHGIDSTGIKPGFIKTGTDSAPLSETQRKLITAAAITHLATGLAIGIHTGNGEAAFEQLDLLRGQNVSPSARIWFHTSSEPDISLHIRAAKMRSWISYDGVNQDSLISNLDFLIAIKKERLLNWVLISQDSGWYNVGDPNGGTFRPYDCITTQFIPLLYKNGFSEGEIDLLFRKNPARAFAVKVRT